MNRVARLARSFWVRPTVTAALLGVIAFKIDWRRAADRVVDGRWHWFALTVVLLLAALVLGAARWHLLLRAAGLPVRFVRALRAYAIGAFSNTFLPTSFGGDAARAWVIGRSGPGVVRSLTTVAIDRVTALWCLVAVSWISLAADPGAVPGSLVLGLALATLFAVGVPATLVLVAGRGRTRIAARLPERARAWAGDAIEVVRVSLRSRRLLALATALGLAYQTLAIASLWGVARAIDVDLSFVFVAVASPVILVITLVPISIAGFGVREGAAILVFGRAGVSATDATLISLVGFVAVVLSSLPGALWMVLPAPNTAETLNGGRPEESVSSLPPC